MGISDAYMKSWTAPTKNSSPLVVGLNSCSITVSPHCPALPATTSNSTYINCGTNCHHTASLTLKHKHSS
jgi:hypothetical protein